MPVLSKPGACGRYLGNNGRYNALEGVTSWHCTLEPGHVGAHLHEPSGVGYEGDDWPASVPTREKARAEGTDD